MPDFSLETPPPSDPTAEANVLSCMMLDAEALVECLSALRPEDFYHPKNQTLFAEMQAMHSANEPVDMVTLPAHLDKAGRLESVGGRVYILQLSEQMASGANVGHYAKIIRECAQYRQAIRVGMRLIDEGHGRKATVEELVGRAVSDIAGVLDTSEPQAMPSLGESLEADFELIKRMQEGSEKPRRVYLGFPALDELSGGMMPGEVTLVAARPGLGKTSFGLQVAVNAAASGKKVAIFSIEMPAQQLRMRMLSQRAQVSYYLFSGQGQLTEDELNRIAEQRLALRELPIRINQKSTVSVSTIRLDLQRHYLHDPPDLVVVDYLQQMTAQRKYESKNYEMADISGGLKKLAKDLDTVVLGLCQFNRASEQRANQVPRLVDLRDSGALEQDAALVLAIHRLQDDHGALQDQGSFVVLKNRFGSQGPITMTFDGPKYTFHEDADSA